MGNEVYASTFWCAMWEYEFICRQSSVLLDNAFVLVMHQAPLTCKCWCRGRRPTQGWPPSSHKVDLVHPRYYINRSLLLVHPGLATFSVLAQGWLHLR